jgi:hypothetical protein
LNEPGTTLTDYLLALECAWFVWALTRRSGPSFLRAAFMTLFASVAVAAIIGGTVHGFFPAAESPANRVLWAATMLSIGVTAAAMFAVGTWLGLGAEATRKLPPILGLGLSAYAVVVLFVSRDFVVAIVAYLPAVLFLLTVFLRDWLRHRNRGAAAGILGVMMALVAALAQQLGIGLHPLYFDHNAVYHVLQAVALYLLFRSALALAEPL